ncbi:hypothetical protein HN011_009675 [Eciton burchellii]|nr:hypothetical protein HN011_009675 [Eciton burchellii]
MDLVDSGQSSSMKYEHEPDQQKQFSLPEETRKFTRLMKIKQTIKGFALRRTYLRLLSKGFPVFCTKKTLEGSSLENKVAKCSVKCETVDVLPYLVDKLNPIRYAGILASMILLEPGKEKGIDRSEYPSLS